MIQDFLIGVLLFWAAQIPCMVCEYYFGSKKRET